MLCQPNLPNGLDCAATTTGAVVTLVGIYPCEVTEGTVTDIWGIDMYGTNDAGQQRAWVMDTNATISVIFTKLKDFGQSLRNTTLVNITRTLPGSSNATCNTTAVVPLSNAQYSYVSYNMYGNLTLLMDSSIYCDPPPRGAKRQIQIEFTYNFYFDFPADGRRRRRTTQARQAIDAGMVYNTVFKATVLTVDLYNNADDMVNADVAPQASGASRLRRSSSFVLAALATAIATLIVSAL